MIRVLSIAALIFGTSPALAQSVDWSSAETITISLSSFRYAPEAIRIEHGRPYRLHFVNVADGGHNFVARDFFSAATIAPQDRSRIDDGAIELAAGQSADVRVMIARPGQYNVHCSHFLHTTFGMSGVIIVE